MMLIGGFFNFITFFLYGPICRLVFLEMKENIFLHLEGNAFVYENFYQVSFTRCVLKLDFLANLLFFTCLFFILWNNGVQEEAYVWISTGALLLMQIFANLFGGCTTVLSAKKRTYIAFITLRSIVELIKIGIMLLMWIGNHFLWQQESYSGVTYVQYQEFRINMTVNVGLTFITFLWSIFRIHKAQF